MLEMGNLCFVRFGAKRFALYRQWCREAETQRWLGEPDEQWLEYVVTAAGSFTWMIYVAETSIGQVQVDLFDDDPHQASIAFMVAPEHRKRGYGIDIVRAALTQPELAKVACFHAFIEPENHASVQLVERIGFRLLHLDPDEHGFLEYVYSRST